MKCTLHCKAVPGRGSLLTKLLLVMRITAIFILGVSLHVSANSFSQSITISAKKITIEKAFRLIEQQTDFSFLWNESVLDKSRVISIDVKDAPTIHGAGYLPPGPAFVLPDHGQGGAHRIDPGHPDRRQHPLRPAPAWPIFMEGS